MGGMSIAGRLVLIAVLALALVVAGERPRTATAVTGAEFEAGDIISDQVFYNAGTMSSQNIQDFLNLRGSACVPGEMPCLKDYRVDTPATTTESGLCAGIPAMGRASAAQIIYRVAQACGINPQVLIVLIAKESGLVHGTQPTKQRYDAATGFGCPDFQGCDSLYNGLFNQTYRAARQFKVYTQNPARYGYQAGRHNTILYNPITACGSSVVFIKNQATANLYIYTPYQPNAAALANLNGAGDSCSAYGNRNFWRMFNDWFGSPHATAPSTSSIYLSDVNASVRASTVFGLPGSGQHYVACDWNGDGKDTVAIVNGLHWTLTEGANASSHIGYGGAGDQPVCGDWNGDGKDEIGVFRPSTATFYLRNSVSSGVADHTVMLGNPSDRPLVGDWNGDGKDEIGVYRPSNAHFYLAADTNGGGVQAVWFGDVGDQPLVGSWTGGAASIGVRRGVLYYLAPTPTSAAMMPFGYGADADVSVFADWNGDGVDTIAVVR